MNSYDYIPDWWISGSTKQSKGHGKGKDSCSNRYFDRLFA